MKTRLPKILISAGILMLFSGCSTATVKTSPHESYSLGPPFVDHPNEAERKIAGTGAVLGFVAVIPITIVALPITVPIAANINQTEKSYAWILGVNYGAFICGGTIFGSVAWPFCGWWDTTGKIKEVKRLLAEQEQKNAIKERPDKETK